MDEKVKPDARLNLPRWDAPGDTPSHYVTDDVFTRSTILRVIDEEVGDAPWYSVDQSPPGSDSAVFRAGMEAALANIRARFEEADDG